MPDTYALLDALFSHAPVGVAHWDLDLHYRRVNPALAALIGVAPDEHLGRTPTEVLGAFGTRIEEVLREVAATGAPVVDADVHGEVGGAEVHRQLTIFPVRGEDGALLGVAGVIRDVSEQHEAQAERARLLRDALSSRAQAEAAQVRAEAAREEAEAARRRTEFL